MKKRIYLLLAMILVASLALVACQPKATETPVEKPVAAEEETVTEEEPAEEKPAEQVVEEAPTRVGGTLYYALTMGPDTLDMQLTANGVSDLICTYVGGGLVEKDPTTGEIVPYLAESWEIAEDGLTYTFKLRQDVKFHDGTPFTAHDYAFTINRALDPELASPGTAGMIAGVTDAIATDDYTLVLNLAAPNAILMENLSLDGYMMPYSQAYVEAHDADFLGRNPMSVGPYIFKQWVTGESVVLERNPEYTWGPAFGPGPFNIETIEFRIIPEESTVASGLEAGELHIFETDSPSLITQLKEVDTLNYAEGLYFGVSAIMINTTLPKLADLEMRQALNYALNRDIIVDVVRAGYAVPAYSAFSPAVYGYNEELDQIGYGYNPDKTKELIEGLGYTQNADGYYEKDGEVLSFKLNTMGTAESAVKLAEVVQQQFKEVGIYSEINMMELGMAITALFTADFELSLMDFGMPNASILGLIFGQQGAGGAFFGGLEGIEDVYPLVDGVTTIIDPDAWMENVREAQKAIIVDKALIVPIFVPKQYLFYSNTLNDVVYSIETESVLNNAYFTK